MKKIILTMLAVLLLASGCSSGKGKIEYVSIDRAFEMMDQKESFLLLVSKDSCTHCKDLEAMLKKELPKQDLIIYNVVMDESSATAYEQDKERLSERLDEPNKTPHVYEIKKGEVNSELLGYSAEKPENFWDWVKSLSKNE